MVSETIEAKRTGAKYVHKLQQPRRIYSLNKHLQALKLQTSVIFEKFMLICLAPLRELQEYVMS